MTGGGDIYQGRVDFSAQSSTDDGSCQVQWNSPGVLKLLNQTGAPITGTFGQTPQTALSNGSCTVNPAVSSFLMGVPSQYNSTISLNVTFTSGFTNQASGQHSVWLKNTYGASCSNSSGSIAVRGADERDDYQPAPQSERARERDCHGFGDDDSGLFHHPGSPLRRRDGVGEHKSDHCRSVPNSDQQPEQWNALHHRESHGFQPARGRVACDSVARREPIADLS